MCIFLLVSYFECHHLKRSIKFLEEKTLIRIDFLLLIILDETIKEFVNFIVKNMNRKEYTVIFL